MELDTCRTLISLNNFEVCSLDSEHGSHSVCECPNAPFLEELSQSELEPDCQHDCISVLDEESAARGYPELKSVFNALVSIFTTTPVAFDLAPGLDFIVPVVGRDKFLIRVIDGVCTVVGVPDCNHEGLGSRATEKLYCLLLCGRSSVFDPIVTSLIHQRRELLLTSLTSIHSVPTVVHIGVEPVVVLWLDVKWRVLDVKWLLVPGHAVWISAIYQENSEIVVLTDIAVPLVAHVFTEGYDLRRN